MKKLLIIKCIMLALIYLSPVLLQAQTGFDDDVADVPIDGGLSLLLIAGVGYVVTKAIKRKRNAEI